MLKRIRKIQNIGRFADCKAAGCEFAKETIVFGFNAQGKSTLTAIIRSIQTGNNDILIGRKTFGATAGMSIEIDFEDGDDNDRYVFQNRAWNKANPDILIFDSKFIADNVFEGEKVTFNQQKNLNAVIIDKKGQDLNNEIVALQKKSEEYTNQKGEKTREFTRHFPNSDLEEFKALPEDTGIANKIKDKEKEIKFEREKEDIKKATRNHIQSLSSYHFSIRETLKKTLDVKQEEIEAHINSQFATHKNAWNFLSEGLDLLKAKPSDGTPRTCVFCGQELGANAESLVSHYSAYFKGGYEELQNEMNKAIEYFKGINFEATLEKISADLRAKELDIGLANSKISELADLQRQFEKELDKKRDLNYVIDFDTFDRLKVGIEKIKSDLEKLEQNKLNMPSPKTGSALESEKRTLDITKKRYEPEWVKFCRNLETIEVEAEEIRTARDEKRKELEEYSSEIFDTHMGTINRFCKDMGADFEVEDFKPLKKIVGKDERIFALKIFGSHKVSIDNENDKTPNFRNTLSESDKRLLAFAFFISLLSHDRELEKKIVVFDDPMSSFDIERRRKTLHLIADIACKQKIILTHEERFAKQLEHLMPCARTLKIKEYVDTKRKRSKIAHADFAQDFPDDEIPNLVEKLKGMLDTRTFADSLELDCRVVLEHIFKCKYKLELKTAISQRKSVRTFTEELMKIGIGGFDDPTKSKQFVRLCDDLNIELHDGTTANSTGDQESILKDFSSV